MRNKRILSFFSILVILLSVMSCKEFKEAQVTGVKDFKIKKLGLTGIEADLELIIKNPNTSGFSIYPSEFDVIFSGINLGKARLRKRVHIKGNSEKPYVFEMNSSFTNVNLMELAGLVSGSKLGGLQTRGDLKVGKLGFKKRVPIDYKTNNYNLTR